MGTVWSSVWVLLNWMFQKAFEISGSQWDEQVRSLEGMFVLN